jgi:hypothetical protein
MGIIDLIEIFKFLSMWVWLFDPTMVDKFVSLKFKIELWFWKYKVNDVCIFFKIQLMIRLKFVSFD